MITTTVMVYVVKDDDNSNNRDVRHCRKDIRTVL